MGVVGQLAKGLRAVVGREDLQPSLGFGYQTRLPGDTEFLLETGVDDADWLELEMHI